MDKRKKLIEILEDMNASEIIEIYNYAHEYDGEGINEQDDYYWDNCDEDRSILMHMVANNDVDLDDDYVKVRHNGDYVTFSESDVWDYICIPELADWILDKPERLDLCGIELEITYADIYAELGKIISGLTKIFLMIQEKDYDGIQYNLQNQISALNDLKKEVKEKSEEKEE